MATPVKLSDCLKALPKYSDSEIEHFEDYVNKVTHFLEIFEIEEEKSKIRLLQYAVAERPRLNTILKSIDQIQNNTFEKFSGEAIQIINGKVKPSSGEIIRVAWTLKRNHFNSNKEYYQEFIDLQSKTSDTIDQSTLIECFFSGLPDHLESVVRSRLNATTQAKTLNLVYKLTQEAKPDKPSLSSSVQVNNMKNRYNNYNKFKNHNQVNKKSNNSNQNSNQNNKNKAKNFSSRPKNSRSDNPNWRSGKNNRKRCEACGKNSHWTSQCQELKAFIKSKGYRVNNTNVDSDHADDEFDERASSGGETENNWVVGVSEAKSNTRATSSALEPAPVLDSARDNFKNPTRITNLQLSAENMEPQPSIYRINLQKLIRHRFLLKNSGQNSDWNPILDSGAERSTISLENAIKMGVPVIKTINFSVYGFDGSRSDSVVGYLKDIHFVEPKSGHSGFFSPIVIDNKGADICGLDIISTIGGGCFSKIGENKLKFEFDPNFSGSTQTPGFKIKSSRTLTIPPGATETIQINKVETNTDVIIDSKGNKGNEIFALSGIIDSNTDKITIFNSNLEKEIKIQKDQVIAKGFEADLQVELGEFPTSTESNEISHNSELSDKDFLKLLENKLGHIKIQEQKDKILKILLKHKRCFDVSSDTVGQYPIEVSINPYEKDIEVKAEKRRIFNPNVWSQLNTQLDKLRNLGLIEDCPFPTISPANLVAAKRKGSDKIRLCVDFRRLNEEISGNFFPLPTKSELFDSLDNFNKDAVFIQLDIASCFWNFKLKDQDRHLTAFYTQDGVMQWKVLPFGVKSAPGIVQHALSSLTKNIGLDKSTSRSHFIDDDAFCVKNFETALTDLDKILTAYGDINLKIKLEKCSFLTKSIFFMGSELKITSEGVKLMVNPKNTEDLKKMAPPNTAKELKTFLGMCNWISDYIPQMHIELGPLHNLVSKCNRDKNVKFSELWDTKINNLFEEIKTKISDSKTLSVPDYSKPFELEVDASSHGFGAVLTQKHKIIGYASKALTKQAISYDNVHRETAGVVWAIEKFREFFICNPHPTKVFTDNRVTSFINSAKNSKLRRWRSYLDAHNISIEHKNPAQKCS